MMRQKQQMNKAAEKMPLSLGELFYSDPTGEGNGSSGSLRNAA